MYEPTVYTPEELQERVADALHLAALDRHGKYDECFVDRLLKSSSNYLNNNTYAEKKLDELYRMHSSNGNEDVNTTRMLKFHISLVETDNLKPPGLTASFLNVLPNIMLRNNYSEISAALALLLELACNDRGLRDLRLFNLPGSQNYPHQITNIFEISRHYMLKSKSYLIEFNARCLFISLIIKLSVDPGDASLVECLRQILNELITVIRSPLVYQAIAELFDTAPNQCLTTELFQYIKQLLRQAFILCFEMQSDRSLVSLTKCLAKAKIPHTEIFDKLKQTDNLEAIITYVTNINVFTTPSLFYFIIYPILFKCDSEDARLLESRLFLTRDEKYFIQKNFQARWVQQCLYYIRLATVREDLFKHTHFSARNCEDLPIPKLHYSLEVVMEYLTCNYEDHKAYKNLLECCSILKDGQGDVKRSIWLFDLTDAMFSLIERTDLSVRPHIRPIFLGVLQILARCIHRTSLFHSPSKLGRIKKNWLQIIQLAFRHNDPDVLCEFANIFHLTSPDPDQGDIQFTQLIWNHMLPLARENEHHELLGVLMDILVKIDMNTSKTALEAINIKRHKDIPSLISEILSDFSTVNIVVERIVICVVNADAKESLYPSQNSEGRQWARTKISYLEWLDSATLPSHAKRALDSLISRICSVIRGDCDEKIRGKAMIEINSIISTLLINEDSPERLLKRLVRSGILELLYTIGTCSLYSSPLKKIAATELSKIRLHVLEKFGTMEDIALKINGIMVEKHDTSIPELSDHVKKMTGFLTTKIECKKLRRDAVEETESDILGLESYLNDILDYSRIDWGPSECY